MAATTLAAQLPNLLAGLAYANFHTTEFPAGEIQQQLDFRMVMSLPMKRTLLK